VDVNGRRCIHGAVPLDRRGVGGGQYTLHVFYPQAQWREACWQASWPPLAIGAGAVALVVIAAYLVSAHVTGPIERLRLQVGRLPERNVAPLPLPPRDDEIRDLAQAVNQLTETLARYEDQTRKNERLRTLGTLGGGIAHQIRNAATGCRMAIDLHRHDCPQAGANGQHDEPLAIAARQLDQIEAHIQRFLTLGRPAPAQRREVNLADVALSAIELVRPMAAHVGVKLALSRPSQSLAVQADAAALVQAVVNLLVNAVEAAARTRVAAGAAPAMRDSAAMVTVRLVRAGSDRCELAVGDPGDGPLPAIQPQLFEPFFSDKPGGTGLGLAVARQVAEEHGGSIRWERRNQQTWFLVELPAAQGGAA
jgi:signal transduction histidine kinase